MNNAVTYKLDFHIDDPIASFSLMKLVMDNLGKLQEFCSGLKYVEVKLLHSATAENKMAHLKLVGDSNNILETSSSKRWDDAFMNAFDKVRSRFQ